MSNKIIYKKRFEVSFGHCDPAGIVYYPNFFSWLDQTFHGFLDDHLGGHAKLCDLLDSKGLGLINADAQFRSPVLPGSKLTVEMHEPEWTNRAATIFYTGKVGETLALQGQEVRGVFGSKDGKMIAKPVAELRQMFERCLNE